MGSCGLTDGMERKELPLFTRIDPLFPLRIVFDLTGHKRSLTFYMVVQKIGILYHIYPNISNCTLFYTFPCLIC